MAYVHKQTPAPDLLWISLELPFWSFVKAKLAILGLYRNLYVVGLFSTDIGLHCCPRTPATTKRRENC